MMYEKVYIGSSIKFKDDCKELSQSLFNNFNITTTRKWWSSYVKEIDKFVHYSNEEFMNHPQVRAIGEADFKAIDEADFVVIIVKNQYKPTGAYVECGYALGKNKPVYILGQPKRSAMLARCIRIDNLEQFLSIVNEIVK